MTTYVPKLLFPKRTFVAWCRALLSHVDTSVSGWAVEVDVNFDPEGTPFVVLKSEDGEFKGRKRIGVEAIRRALVRLCDPNQDLGLHATYRATAVGCAVLRDEDSLDAEVADWFLQIAVFGEVLYG